MKDIKFLGSDGDFLLLEDADGQKYRLLVDDAIRRASRGESQPSLDEPTISPRQIQEEIRVGRSVDEIVNSSGAPIEYVQKFAQPVLDELNHAVLNALTVRLEIAGDRFNEPSNREFGEIIKSRLAASGAGIEKWSAMKAPDHGFFIYCEFELDGLQNKATWSYDPKRLALSPENEVAMKLSSQDRLAPAAAKLWPVSKTSVNLTENLADTVDLASALPTPRNQAVLKTELDDQPVSETGDLLEALRKKRSERESVDSLEPHPSTEGLRVVELRPADLFPVQDQEPELEAGPEDLEPAQENTLEAEPEPTPAPLNVSDSSTPKRGRASIPSWDEIVFGTKTED
jgi:hypothetical protein